VFKLRRAAVDPRLTESEERYRAVIENASDMIQSVRPDGSFEFVNPAWLDTLGYSPDEVDQMVIWDIIHPDSLEHCQELFAIVMQGQSATNVRVIFKTKDGQPIPGEGSVTVRMAGDEVIATHAFFRDISEQLRAEELRDRNEQLELERVAQYYEKMAALGKLSAGLAHELNNPAAAARRASAELREGIERHDASTRELASLGLTAADWQHLADIAPIDSDSDDDASLDDPIVVSEREDAVADWLADHGVDEGWNLSAGLVAAGLDDAALDRLASHLPERSLGTAVRWLAESLAIRAAVDVVSRSAGRMSDLVSAVKAYSHMDRATEQIVDVHEGLKNTRVIMAHRLRNIRVLTEFDRTLPLVRAYGSGLNQVWTNIIDNAVDATDGRGTIAIRTQCGDGRVLVEIEDNGGGIPPENITRIFEPFYTTKPQGAGTGLGLDTAWRIVTEEHGGKMEVDSIPGRTVFRVYLPLADAANPSTTAEPVSVE
jgi:PAS domain S-box-containing protein